MCKQMTIKYIQDALEELDPAEVCLVADYIRELKKARNFHK